LGTGPFNDGAEHEAAHLLRQLTDYTSTVVRQEIHHAQLQREHGQGHHRRRDGRLTAGGLLGLLGLATLVAAVVISLASVIGAGLAAIAVGTTLLAAASGLILSGSRRAARASRADGAAGM
jgi:hypothetical protein